jgi:hypothetical protein
VLFQGAQFTLVLWLLLGLAMVVTRHGTWVQNNNARFTFAQCTPHLEFAVRVQEDIGRLDVPVDHLGAVHELQGTQHLQQHARVRGSHKSAASFITTCLREYHDTVQQRRQQATMATPLG